MTAWQLLTETGLGSCVVIVLGLAAAACAMLRKDGAE